MSEVAYDLYPALVAAGHAPWCPALDGTDSPCRCGRDSALEAFEAERVRVRAVSLPVGRL